MLADLLLSLKPSEDSIRRQQHQIHDDLLARSQYLRQPNFTRIHPRDLESLFGLYDERFLEGACRRALKGRPLTFRLSPRMTTSGGKTTRTRHRNGEVTYEIAVASSMLFDAFRATDRRISVCGLECEDRLEALQRIFEHEMVHLGEQLCWETSDCARPRFQEIAGRLFGHRAHTHSLITRRERAAASGIRPGSRVTFTFEGKRLTGRVNRITKRATVLVEDPAGMRYSDGSHYKAYYVPIASLQLAPTESETARG
jgi:hypothetical protein